MKTGMNEKESKVLTKRPDTIPCTNKNNKLTHIHTKKHRAETWKGFELQFSHAAAQPQDAVVYRGELKCALRE